MGRGRQNIRHDLLCRAGKWASAGALGRVAFRAPLSVSTSFVQAGLVGARGGATATVAHGCDFNSEEGESLHGEFLRMLRCRARLPRGRGREGFDARRVEISRKPPPEQGPQHG